MSLKKPVHPLNTAIFMLSLVVLLHAVFSVALTVLWIYRIDCALPLTGTFLLLGLLFVFYAVYSLYCNSRSMSRDRFKFRSLSGFVVAAVVYAGAGLYNGYRLNSLNHTMERLNGYYSKNLDDDKLCAALMRGEDPADRKFAGKTPQEILKNGVPKFRGVYTGSFLNSFGDGGKEYLKLGRYSIAAMKKAAEKKESKAFTENVLTTIKIIRNASVALRDPEGAAGKLVQEFIPALQECVSTTFPENSDFQKIIPAMSFLYGNFEYNQLGEVTYIAQAVLNRYRALLSGKERFFEVVDAENKPAWSEADNFAARIFFTAQRNRFINDFDAALSTLNTYRVAQSSGDTPLKERLASVAGAREKLKFGRHGIALSLIPDIRRIIALPVYPQALITTSYLALEVENFRRENGNLPAKLSYVESYRLMSIPKSSIDGSEYKIVKGRFRSSNDKKEYAGYSVTAPGFSFVIPNK